MHDEATTTYSANIDQMTQGHQFLLQTFNVTPTIGMSTCVSLCRESSL